MMENLLIWDIDGTILDCKGCGRKALNIAFERVYSVNNAFDSVNMSGKVDKEIINEAIQCNNIDCFDHEKFIDEYEIALGEVLESGLNVELLPGVEKLLNFLHDNEEHFFAIATGNCKVGAHGKLKHCNIDSYFSIGVYGDEAVDRTELVKLAIDKSRAFYNRNFENKNIFYLGDTPSDIIAAHQNNINSIAVATGYHDHEELNKFKPNYLFNNFTDIEKFIKIIK